MQGTGASVTVEELLSHSGWVRRVARQLVRGEVSEDVVQDVWAHALERPPRPGSLRGWLARVVLNRVRMSARAETRRRRREQATVAATAVLTTPEDAVASWELQRLLATLVADLPEPYRHVIYLRYVEDREPSEIAAELGIPAGTIRWRLKEALTRLRAKLDEQDPERRQAWVAVAALGGRGRPAARRASPVARITISAVGALAIAGFAVATNTVFRRDRPLRSSGGQPDPSRRPQRLQLAAATLPDESGDCPAVAPLRAQLLHLQDAADPWRDPRELFAHGEPNPTLEAAVAPIVDARFASVAQGCQHSVSCRGRVCEISILVPAAGSLQLCAPAADPTFVDRLSSGRNNILDSGTPFYDPLARAPYMRHSLVWRFERDDARAVPPAARPSLPPLRYDFSTPLPSAPPTLSEVCRKSWRRTSAELEELRRSLQSIHPEVAFPSSSPDAALTGRVTAWARQVLERPVAALPFDVECRARMCALRPGAPSDALAIAWQCRTTPTGDEVCFPRPDSNDWFDRLNRQRQSRGRLHPPLRHGQSGPIDPGFLYAERETPGASSPLHGLLGYMDSFDWRSAVASCARQFSDPGTLDLRIHLPKANGVDDPAPRVELDVGGALGGTPLSSCVADAFRVAAAAYVVPPNVEGAVLYTGMHVPLDTAKLDAKLTAMRQRLRDEQAAAFW